VSLCKRSVLRPQSVGAGRNGHNVPGSLNLAKSLLARVSGKGAGPRADYVSTAGAYLLITPQAIRSPALPAGSDFMSSALA
jgi:hypothetical protein